MNEVIIVKMYCRECHDKVGIVLEEIVTADTGRTTGWGYCPIHHVRVDGIVK